MFISLFVVCKDACHVVVPSPVEHQIPPAVCVLMKLSFDEEHRHAMNELGEFHPLGRLILTRSCGSNQNVWFCNFSLQGVCRRWRSCCRWTAKCSV